MTFATEVLKSPEPVLVVFDAPWCHPCVEYDMVLHAVTHHVKIVHVNTDDNPALCADYSITGLPSSLLFKEGRAVEKMVGYAPLAKLRSFLERNGVKCGQSL